MDYEQTCICGDETNSLVNQQFILDERFQFNKGGITMQRLIFCYVLPMAILFATLQLTTSLSAQPIWLEQTSGNSIAIEVLKPNFKGDDDFTFISSALFLSGRFSLGGNLIFVGEVPLAHANLDDIKIVDPSTGETIFELDFESETIIGNPYVGLQFHKPGSNIFTEIGGRIPVTPDDKFSASSIGASADFDRLEAFASDLLAITGKINYHNKNASNLVIRLRGGPTVWIPTDEGDTELLLDYSAQVGYEGQQVSVIGGLTGRLIVTEEDLDFGERTFHHLGASASLNLGTVSLGIHFRIPIDEDLSDSIDSVLGLNLVFQL